jgi:arylsulfatase A-like enzyme
MKNIILIACLLTLFSSTKAQQSEADRPKLVVGIIVDQMRQEYLYRFYNKFGDGGFKRLMNDGFMLKNAHYNFVPTWTAPGHASVYTGTTPAVHGVIGNDWFDKDLNKRVYCVKDEKVATVGSVSFEEGNMSPHRLISTTITDELKFSTQKRAKVIGLSIKDRGAILPAGHMADAAYWFDKVSGRFITSTFYMNKLPVWVENFNKLGLAEKYSSKVWTPLLPLEQYTESWPDVNPYEGKISGAEKASFPYDVAAMKKVHGNYEALSETPFSDDLLTDMAKATLDGEKLGQDEWTDFLCISYSAPDKLGHDVGPYAVELEDLYIRLDKNLEDFLKKLDQSVGNQNYIVFLTADHAVSDVPQYMIDNKISGGALSTGDIGKKLNDYLKSYFPGKELIRDIFNEQIFLNHEAFSDDPKKGGVDLLVATELISGYLLQEKGIASVYSKSLIRQGDFNEGGHKGMVIRGYHPKRSGDIAFVLEPHWIDFGKFQGADHSSPYAYDTHVPVLFYGKGIKKGSSVQYHAITDIAPTLSVMLKTKFPSGCVGQPIAELFD